MVRARWSPVASVTCQLAIAAAAAVAAAAAATVAAAAAAYARAGIRGRFPWDFALPVRGANAQATPQSILGMQHTFWFDHTIHAAPELAVIMRVGDRVSTMLPLGRSLHICWYVLTT